MAEPGFKPKPSRYFICTLPSRSNIKVEVTKVSLVSNFGERCFQIVNKY